MTDIIVQRIDAVLKKYGIRGEYQDHLGIAFSPTMDMILRAMPWQLRTGSEKYEDLYDLMALAIDLKCPKTKCVVGDMNVDHSFRGFFLDGIKNHIVSVLGQVRTPNYQYLSDFIFDLFVKEGVVQIIDINPGLLQERVESRLFRNNQTYSSIPKKEFQSLVQEEYQFIKEHPELARGSYSMPRHLAGSPRQDDELLSKCLAIFDNTCIPKDKIDKSKEHLQRVWTYVLGQKTVSDILEEFYQAIDPGPSITETDVIWDVRRKDVISSLPYAMDSPEYIYVKSLFEEYHEHFSEPWAITDNEAIVHLGIDRGEFESLPPWEDKIEPRHLQYLVSQYLYYCLSESILPKKDERNNIIRYGAMIYDLLCVLGYRENNFSEDDDYGDKVIQKEKYDLVKRYLQIDGKTGIYKRLK